MDFSLLWFSQELQNLEKFLSAGDENFSGIATTKLVQRTHHLDFGCFDTCRWKPHARGGRLSVVLRRSNTFLFICGELRDQAGSARLSSISRLEPSRNRAEPRLEPETEPSRAEPGSSQAEPARLGFKLEPSRAWLGSARAWLGSARAKKARNRAKPSQARLGSAWLVARRLEPKAYSQQRIQES